MPLKHVILICVFLLFLLFAVIVGSEEENYCSVIAALITGILCFSFSKEIKKLHEHNRLITYQKNIVTGGFDASLFAFFVFTKNGKCVFVNRIAQNLFPGLKIRTVEDFIFSFGKYPNVVEAIRNLQIAAENIKQSHIDIPIKLHSDSVNLWRIAVSPIPEHSGFTGWTIIDLTPSLFRIESLETNSNFLLEIINGSAAGYFCLNEENEIVFCNKTFSGWLGNRNIINTPFNKYIIREKSENLPSCTDDGKLTNSLPAKIALKAPDGGELEIMVQHIVKNNGGGNVYLATPDIQQNSDIIQILGKTKLYFEHIFEDAPIGIVITDGAEIINSYNRTFQKISGVEDVKASSF
ncbi:MAG: PAS domain-containing protein, partial [Holosporaceae bacterium]|nr:PAS domain-containing protein [Holosporaceae bacterium]